MKCGGSAIADTYEQARKLINHAVGLSRGIKCGDSYNMVKEIKPEGTAKTSKSQTKSKTKPDTKSDTFTLESTKSSSEKPKEKTKQSKSSMG